jgi:hypothetical protein
MVGSVPYEAITEEKEMDNQLTSDNMQLNEVAPSGFCDEPFILSNEVKALRREVNAMRDAMLKLVELLQAG